MQLPFSSMKTRRKDKELPEIIVIESEKQSQEQLKSDDSSCSDAESSSLYSSPDSHGEAFMNLAPINEKKKKKGLIALKPYLSEQKSMITQPQQEFQRAPILNILRPLPVQVQHQEKSSSSDSDDIEPPQLEPQSQQEIKQPEPRKKPRLMEELEKQLNLPAEEYVITGAGREIREQRKRQNKRRDYLIEKKLKEYRVGKKKDNVSNQVFNAIEDFFG